MNQQQPSREREQDEGTPVLVVVYSADITTKSRQTRTSFIRRLLYNLRAALEGSKSPFRINVDRNRIEIETHSQEALQLVSNVIGVQRVGLARRYTYSSLAEIVELGERFFGRAVVGRRFAVRTRRVGSRDQIPIESLQVDKLLGARLYERSAGVDLSNPEVWARLEVQRHQVCFFDPEGNLKGPAGIPIGLMGRALTLISGGFDSAVASWMMLRRGVEQDYLFFDLAGPAHIRGVKSVLSALTRRWSHGSRPKLMIVDLRPLVQHMQEVTKGTYQQVLLKRLMMRVGDLFAQRMGYEALITGECLGQVSTQTLGNLIPISQPLESEVLRPLIGQIKEEIVELSKLIGTHDASAVVPEFCALNAGRPVTSIKTRQLDRLESRLDLSGLEDLLAHCVVVSADLGPEEEDLTTFEIDHIPEEAVIIDLRTPEKYAAWHPKGARLLGFKQLMTDLDQLDRHPTYLLYCDVGLKSCYVAMELKQRGYSAFGFARGVAAMRRWLEGQNDDDEP